MQQPQTVTCCSFLESIFLVICTSKLDLGTLIDKKMVVLLGRHGLMYKACLFVCVVGVL